MSFGETLLANETTVRLSFFVGLLAIFGLWEVIDPKRRRDVPRVLRWSNNLALVAVDTIIVRLIFPIAAAGFAAICSDKGWGLLNHVNWPIAIRFIIAILALDLIIYLQHVVFHAVPALWRLHRVHHADLDCDVTTGLRFHPFEIQISMALKFAVIAVLGPSAVAVLLFEVLLNGTSLFNHANIRLSKRTDGILRLFVVTPDMHRVHHSQIPDETNSNFGFNLPWWDRLLGTYKPQPSKGHTGMTIGLSAFRTRRDLWVDKLLLQPFRRMPDEASNLPPSKDN